MTSVIGMTRALIADPEMPNKARRAAWTKGDIPRLRIACSQACIGHFLYGYLGVLYPAS